MGCRAWSEGPGENAGCRLACMELTVGWFFEVLGAVDCIHDDAGDKWIRSRLRLIRLRSSGGGKEKVDVVNRQLTIGPVFPSGEGEGERDTSRQPCQAATWSLVRF